MTDKEYFARPELSQSDLKLLAKSYKHFLLKKEQPEEEKEYFNFGNAYHCLILEPEKFNDNFVILPECDRRTKIGKEIFESFSLHSEGKILIKNDEYNTLLAMQKVFNYSIIQFDLHHLFENSAVEEALTFEVQNVPARAKLDLIDCDNFAIIDLKTIANFDMSWEYVIKKYKLHWQAFWYRQAARHNFKENFVFYFVFQEKSEPFGVKVIQLSESYYELAYNEISIILDKYKNWIKNPITNLIYEPIIETIEPSFYLTKIYEIEGEDF